MIEVFFSIPEACLVTLLVLLYLIVAVMTGRRVYAIEDFVGPRTDASLMAAMFWPVALPFMILVWLIKVGQK